MLGRKHTFLTGVMVSTAGALYSILHSFGAILMSENHTNSLKARNNVFGNPNQKKINFTTESSEQQINKRCYLSSKSS